VKLNQSYLCAWGTEDTGWVEG